jgi:hypothetical protein
MRWQDSLDWLFVVTFVCLILASLVLFHKTSWTGARTVQIEGQRSGE